MYFYYYYYSVNLSLVFFLLVTMCRPSKNNSHFKINTGACVCRAQYATTRSVNYRSKLARSDIVRCWRPNVSQANNHHNAFPSSQLHGSFDFGSEVSLPAKQRSCCHYYTFFVRMWFHFLVPRTPCGHGGTETKMSGMWGSHLLVTSTIRCALRNSVGPLRRISIQSGLYWRVMREGIRGG